MKCKYCGYENIEEAKFCAGCGENLAEEKLETIEPEVVQEQEPHVPKCFDVFAKLGFGLGLGGLIACIFAGIGYTICAPGIVFSILGKRSIKYHGKANAGLVLSIIGTVVGFIIYVVVVALIELWAGNTGSGYYY